MFSRLRQIATTNLWKYSDDTPIDTLNRHYRIAKAIVYPGLASSVIMVSSLFEFIFASEGLWRTVTMVIAMTATGLALLLMFPSLLCGFWAEEIEKTLLQRGFPLPGPRRIEQQVGITAMKMCFWVAVLILGVHLFK